MPFDIAIVGGGPAGLSAALVLGRACKRVVLFDAGPPRNDAAAEIHGFLTRDGTPPAEFRRIAREQLRPYDVEIRDARVEAIEQGGASFRVHTAAGAVEARRVLLCTGMIDELPALPGYRELWGKSIFQCPYCHGWEVRGRAFGYIASAPEWLSWAPFLTGWSDDVVVFTSGQLAVPVQVAEELARARIRVEERPMVGLRARDGQLAAVELAGGAEVAREILFVRPPQRQTPLVASLGVALDAQGFVQVDERGQTSVPGIYAAGDSTPPATPRPCSRARSSPPRPAHAQPPCSITRSPWSSPSRSRVDGPGVEGSRRAQGFAAPAAVRRPVRHAAGVTPCTRRNMRMKCVASA